MLPLPLSLPLLSSTATRRLMRVESIARVAELAQRFLSSHLPPSLRALYSLPRVGQGVLWTAMTCTWMACCWACVWRLGRGRCGRYVRRTPYVRVSVGEHGRWHDLIPVRWGRVTGCRLGVATLPCGGWFHQDGSGHRPLPTPYPISGDRRASVVCVWFSWLLVPREACRSGERALLA